jgi:phosphopantothenoylcysteine decarboxylase/phosphopantothenate--cysteine ligase
MQFVTPLTFQALSGNPVAAKLLDANEENAMEHINLARWADKIVIAPASANMIAKLSHGIADDLLSTIYLAAKCPVYIAPSMNQAMWSKIVTQENIHRLTKHGVHLIGPDAGGQACGETGFGRMTEPADIELALNEMTTTNVFQGLKILISAGPTREALDPVRYISNRSSGKMGYALAEAAIKAGATVTLVSGPVELTAPKNVQLIKVETAEQMYQAILSIAGQQDIYIGAAAVADYTPTTMSSEKIKKQAEDSIIKLRKTKDILTAITALPAPPYFVVGFAAETDDLEQYAKSKLKQKKLDLIAANWVGKDQGGFDKDENALQIYWDNGEKFLKMTTKKQLAEQLIFLIAERVNEKNTA